MKSACTSFGHPAVSFDTLKEVRTVERCLLPLEPLVTSFIDATQDLQKVIHGFRYANGRNEESTATIHSAMGDFRREAQSYRIQAVYLHKRCQSTAQSVLDSLNLGYQQLAQSQNKNTFIMARSAREDSVAIRSITLVTSLYLPFSFVAVSLRDRVLLSVTLNILQAIFGTNLVNFDVESHNLLVSNQFWLYFVISIPLTMATLMFWMWKTQSYKKERLIEDTGHEKGSKLKGFAEDIEIV
jgi:hypothetical protein